MVDKDRIAGSAKEIKGSVKQAAGKLVGDAKLESQGAAEKTAGKIQNAVGGLKDTLKETPKAGNQRVSAGCPLGHADDGAKGRS